MKKCPFCAEDIQDAAIVCKHCGRDLPASAQGRGPFPESLGRSGVPRGAQGYAAAPARKRRSPLAIGCLVVLGAVIVLWVLGSLGSRSSGPSSSSRVDSTSVPSVPADSVKVLGATTKISEVYKLMEDLQRIGLITRINENTNEIQVNGLLWSGFDLNGKKGVALVCAQYFKARNVSGSPELVDNRTGRKLASVSEWSGVKIGE
jgi:hypothetical protein